MLTDNMESDDLKPADKSCKGGKVKSSFQQFCSSTSLHGFQYVGDHSVPIIERICWAIAVCLGISTCSYLIHNVYQKWVTTPVIVSFAQTSTRVQEIPFPAVTICSGNKIRKSVFDFKAVLFSGRNHTEEEMLKLGYSSLLCKALSELGWDTIVDDRAIKFLEEGGSPLDDMIKGCHWRNNEINCADVFSSVLTDAGLCYTFNILKAEELFTENVDSNQFVKHLNHGMTASWSMEGKYLSDDEDLFPFRSFSSGSKEGLSFYYAQDTNELSDSCGFPGFGFKVLVHSPVDFPQVSTQYFRVPAEHDVVVGILANMIETSKGLQRNLKPADRRCFMSYERDLHFFKVYSESNCELECFVNISLKLCNCSSFYMPRAPDTPLCGAGSNDCLDSVLGLIHLEEESTLCDCLPSCTDIRYNIEVSESKVRWNKALFGPPDNGRLVGRIQIYFKRNSFITRRRSELYGVTDFIANCGGLLGLFLGFSFLSLVEVFYFLLMRPLVALSKVWCQRDQTL